ncbi:MAG: peptidoglycan DD-metalloendopeptidase family protein [Methyloprofundus sp.]|nr:peptidoglycan DD-metalloendopeptidase family protein [Methyloprofundus sp.]
MLLFLLGSHTLCVAAINKDKELSQVQNKIQSVANNLAQLKKQQNKATAELKRIEQQHGKIARVIQSLSSQVQQKQQRIYEIQQEMQLQNGWLLMQQARLAEQVKSAYALGRQEQLKLLFNQQDISRSSRIMTYYQYFNRARLDKLSRINASLQLLNTLDQENKLEKQELATLIADNKQQQNELVGIKKERKKILAKINKNYRKNTTQLSGLRKNEKQLKRLISTLQKVSSEAPTKKNSALPFDRLKGKLPWPVKGKIVRTFNRPRSGGVWDGVLIKAKEGTAITAIARGKVIFSEWLNGYGLLVIVQHEKKYMSLYAFNQSLYKNVGSWVDAGDVLATVGSSGGRDKPGLYFEIRKKGKPLNPKQWCKKRF